MPYPVPPPPPPVVVEVERSTSDNAAQADASSSSANLESHEAVTDRASHNAVSNSSFSGTTQQNLHSPRPFGAGWPSLLSAPDVFSTEFSGRSAIEAGTQLTEFDGGTPDASLLGTPLVLESSPNQPSHPPSEASVQSGLLFTSPPEHSNPLFHTSTQALTSEGYGLPVTYATKTLPSLTDSLQFIPQYPQLPSGSHNINEVNDVEAVVLNAATVSEFPGLDAEVANEAVQLSDDMKALDEELLEPLEETFRELYGWVQQHEQTLAEQASSDVSGSVTPEIAQSSTNQTETNQTETNQTGSPSDEDFLDLAPVLEAEPVDSPLPETPTSETPASESENIEQDTPLNVPGLDQIDEPDLENLDDSDTTILESDEFEGPNLENLEIEDFENSGQDNDPALDTSTPSTEPTLDGSPTEGDTTTIPQSSSNAPEASGDVIELTSDSQTYDTERQIFIAEGNVEMMVRGATLNADRVQVNLPNRIAVAEGDVFFTRGTQILRGDRIEYNFVLGEGDLIGARGEIFLPGVGSDLNPDPTSSAVRVGAPPVSDGLAREQPPLTTATTVGGLTIGASGGTQGSINIQGGSASGEVRKLRFEADNINFFPDGFEANNVRFTNDPFSPPELELRAEQATFRRLSPTRSELITRRPRLVFDQGLSVPLFRRRFIFDSEQRNAAILQFGFDDDDRGGLFVEREFDVIASPIARLTLRPQFFIQRTFDNAEDDDGDDFSLTDAFGLIANFDLTVGSRTTIDSRVELTSFDLSDIDDELRASVRVNHDVLPINFPYSNQVGYHTLTAEYSFRDRLFNGTLGFQTVEETVGLIFTSPRFQITRPDIYGQALDLVYQAAIQSVTATVDPEFRDDILGPPPREDNLATLMRYQAAAELRYPYTFWRGTPLPATPEEGLKYTPSPVVPFLSVVPRVRGVASFYSSGDSQPVITGELTLRGQFGHFSRRFLDYFGFDISYRRSNDGSESPFRFDQLNDREVVSGGASAQIFGPIRAGVRTSLSLDEDEEFDNSFFVEYSRRTYGVIFQFNPDREIGSLRLRVSDFNWNGVPEPFDGSTSSDSSSTIVEPTPDPDMTTDDAVTEPSTPETLTPEEVVPSSTNVTEPVSGEQELVDPTINILEPSEIDSSEGVELNDLEDFTVPNTPTEPFPTESFPTESFPTEPFPTEQIDEIEGFEEQSPDTLINLIPTPEQIELLNQDVMENITLTQEPTDSSQAEFNRFNSNFSGTEPALQQ